MTRRRRRHDSEDQLTDYDSETGVDYVETGPRMRHYVDVEARMIAQENIYRAIQGEDRHRFFAGLNEELEPVYRAIVPHMNRYWRVFGFPAIDTLEAAREHTMNVFHRRRSPAWLMEMYRIYKLFYSMCEEIIKHFEARAGREPHAPDLYWCLENLVDWVERNAHSLSDAPLEMGE